MGRGGFDQKKYRTFTQSTVGQSTDEIYKSRAIHKNLDPKGVVVRESRDSDDNPNSTPVIVALDVTASMGILADAIARQGLGVLFGSIIDRKPITDPHIMFMAIGDEIADEAPLQVSQFEADKSIIEQLTQIYLEGGGAGNLTEGYSLAWYFAAYHTVHDSMEKRAKRGYLFTVGDEEAPRDLTAEQIDKILGGEPKGPLTVLEVLKAAQRVYSVYHIIIGEGFHAEGHPDAVRETWRKVLGENAIWLSDHTKLAETVVSVIEVAEGVDAATSAAGWGAGEKVVYEAVKGLIANKPMGQIDPPRTAA